MFWGVQKRAYTCFRPHLVALMAYSWLYAQVSPLEVFGRPYKLPGIKPGLPSGKARALSPVLSLTSNKWFLKRSLEVDKGPQRGRKVSRVKNKGQKDSTMGWSTCFTCRKPWFDSWHMATSTLPGMTLNTDLRVVAEHCWETPLKLKEKLSKTGCWKELKNIESTKM